MCKISDTQNTVFDSERDRGMQASISPSSYNNEDVAHCQEWARVFDLGDTVLVW